MAIVVNGQLQPDAANLESLLEQMGYHQMNVATALNGRFIAADDRRETRLVDGDRVEIVAPMQGG